MSKIIKKKDFRLIHIYISVFFIPFMLMYVVTGLMYILGYNQDAWAIKHKEKVELILSKEDLAKKLKDYALENNVKIPNEPPFDLRGKELGLAYSGPSYSLSIYTDMKENKTYISRVDRSFLGTLLMMHKGKAGLFINIIAGIFCFGLFMIYLSGFLYTAFCKQNRKTSLSVFVAGVLFFSVLYISVL